MAQAIALETGYFGVIREAGAKFPVPDGTPSSTWFRVEGEATLPDESPIKPLEEMKAGELIAYAEANGLDIGGLVPQNGATKILAAIKAAQA